MVSCCDTVMSVVRSSSVTNLFNRHLLNRSANFNKTSQEFPWVDLSQNSLKKCNPCISLVAMATDWKHVLKIIKNQSLVRFWNNFIEMLVGWSSYKIGNFVTILQKTWPPMGMAHFSLYVYSKLFFSKANVWIWLQIGSNVP